MVDTARTTSALLTNIFPDGLGPNSLRAQQMRDLVVSAPQWDTISSVATPYLLRGTLDVQAYFAANGGVVGGAGTTLQRQTNATVLQNAINLCCTNGKFFEHAPGTYEIDVVGGLTVPAEGTFGNYNFVARGAQNGSVISQFNTSANGSPIITFGDTTNVTEMAGASVQGFTFQYGTSVTGKTSAVGVVIGWTVNSEFNDIIINGFTNPPYDAMQINGLSFSNNFRNWLFWGWQRHGCYINSSTTTGNSNDNWYMTPGGNPTFPSISGNYIFFNAVASDMWFSRLNCEWGATNAVIRAGDNADCFGLKFDALHIEGVSLTGVDPSIFRIASTNMQVSSMDIQSLHLLAANFTGNAALVHDFAGGQSTVKIENFNYVENAGAGQQDSTFNLLSPQSLDASCTVMTVESGRTSDPSNQIVGRIAFDQHLTPTANVLVSKWNRYEFGLLGSLIKRAVLKVSGAYSHYGQYDDAVIVLAATGSYIVNLMHVMGATGTQLPRTGNTVVFLRPIYTSGTVTIQDNGGALTTNASTAAVYCQYNGSVWVTFTPVT